MSSTVSKASVLLEICPNCPPHPIYLYWVSFLPWGQLALSFGKQNRAYFAQGRISGPLRPIQRPPSFIICPKNSFVAHLAISVDKEHTGLNESM